MPSLLILDTGGTFNKRYDPIDGTLYVEKTSQALHHIVEKWLTAFEIRAIIGKDSLDMTTQDRLEIMMHLHHSDHQAAIVVHGTDTMHVTAEYIAQSELDIPIVLTGAMVPYSIDPVEATANFASAVGFLRSNPQAGVYIAMHGHVAPWEQLTKDKQAGLFVKT